MHMRAFTTASIAAANSRGSKSAEDRPPGHKHRERARAAVIGLTHGVHESTGHSRGLALDLARTQLVSIHSVSLNSSRVLHGASGLTVGHNCRSDCERERERNKMRYRARFRHCIPCPWLRENIVVAAATFC